MVLGWKVIKRIYFQLMGKLDSKSPPSSDPQTKYAINEIRGKVISNLDDTQKGGRHVLVVFYRFRRKKFGKWNSRANVPIVLISSFVFFYMSSQMSIYETQGCVMNIKSNSNSTFVTLSKKRTFRRILTGTSNRLKKNFARTYTYIKLFTQ